MGIGWFNIIADGGKGGKALGAADSLQVFDQMRRVADYDTAKKAEAWAARAEDKILSGQFDPEKEEDYFLRLVFKNVEIVIIANPF